MIVPSARRSVLVLLAGIVWSGVGLVLIWVASLWLLRSDRYAVAALVIGIIGGVLTYSFGFSRLVARNLKRIRDQAPGKERVCVFAFQNWRSYLTIVLMVALGYTLRHLPVAKVYIAPVYLTIGLGLLLASFGYYSQSD